MTFVIILFILKGDWIRTADGGSADFAQVWCIYSCIFSPIWIITDSLIILAESRS
jgi:hypothetical protein